MTLQINALKKLSFFLFLVAHAWTAACAERTSSDIELEARFRGALQSIVEETGAPGGTAAYVLPDGRMTVVAAGWADPEERAPMSSNSRMLSGSVGKTFFAAVAVSMSLDGTVDLDTPVSRWLADEPWFDRLPKGGQITLRHLLSHSAGLIDHVFLPEYAEAISTGKIDLLNENPDFAIPISFALDREPLFAPGRAFSYTDTGYLIAGLAIEKASGHAYYDELRDRILEPLQLSSTSPSNRARLLGLVPGFLPPDNPFNLPVRTTVQPEQLAFNPGFEWTGGGLITNAGDLAIFAKMLFEGKALQGSYLPTMLDGSPVEKLADGSGYGLGVGIQLTEFGLAYGHSGWFPGYTSFMAYFPDHRVAIAAQFNFSPNSEANVSPVGLAKTLLPTIVIEALSE